MTGEKKSPVGSLPNDTGTGILIVESSTDVRSRNGFGSVVG